uniref:Secreted protein n=1 Tax=Heterorhabditis bacteriophora TaxID=37862 RepID=A0A1I7X640_HETBA
MSSLHCFFYVATIHYVSSFSVKNAWNTKIVDQVDFTRASTFLRNCFFTPVQCHLSLSSSRRQMLHSLNSTYHSQPIQEMISLIKY